MGNQNVRVSFQVYAGLADGGKENVGSQYLKKWKMKNMKIYGKHIREINCLTPSVTALNGRLSYGTYTYIPYGFSLYAY